MKKLSLFIVLASISVGIAHADTLNVRFYPTTVTSKIQPNGPTANRPLKYAQIDTSFTPTGGTNFMTGFVLVDNCPRQDFTSGAFKGSGANGGSLDYIDLEIGTPDSNEPWGKVRLFNLSAGASNNWQKAMASFTIYRRSAPIGTPANLLKEEGTTTVDMRYVGTSLFH